MFLFIMGMVGMAVLYRHTNPAIVIENLDLFTILYHFDLKQINLETEQVGIFR